MSQDKNKMLNGDITIRQATKADWEIIWPLVKDVLSTGETYSYSPSTSKSEAFQIWMQNTQITFVALREGRAVGTYYLKPNQPGLGNHICNAGYMVSNKARGRGIGRQLCLHSLAEAKRLSYTGMQFNFVVSTNVMAISLWHDLGFEIIGRIPRAFRHKSEGLVDALIMYQDLI